MKKLYFCVGKHRIQYRMSLPLYRHLLQVAKYYWEPVPYSAIRKQTRCFLFPSVLIHDC